MKLKELPLIRFFNHGRGKDKGLKLWTQNGNSESSTEVPVEESASSETLTFNLQSNLSHYREHQQKNCFNGVKHQHQIDNVSSDIEPGIIMEKAKAIEHEMDYKLDEPRKLVRMSSLVHIKLSDQELLEGGLVNDEQLLTKESILPELSEQFVEVIDRSRTERSLKKWIKSRRYSDDGQSGISSKRFKIENSSKVSGNIGIRTIMTASHSGRMFKNEDDTKESLLHRFSPFGLSGRFMVEKERVNVILKIDQYRYVVQIRHTDHQEYNIPQRGSSRCCLKVFETDETSDCAYESFKRELIVLIRLSRSKSRTPKLLGVLGDIQFQRSSIAYGGYGLITEIGSLNLRQFVDQKLFETEFQITSRTRQILQMLRDMSATMKEIHALDLIHGDLVPDNIYLKLYCGQNLCKYRPIIGGFGFSRVSGDEQKAYCLDLPEDIFPLLFLGRENILKRYKIDCNPLKAYNVDCTTDVYSFGLIAAYVCSGRSPWFFEGDLNNILKDKLGGMKKEIHEQCLNEIEKNMSKVEPLNSLICLIKGCVLSNSKPTFVDILKDIRCLRT